MSIRSQIPSKRYKLPKEDPVADKTRLATSLERARNVTDKVTHIVRKTKNWSPETRPRKRGIIFENNKKKQENELCGLEKKTISYTLSGVV